MSTGTINKNPFFPNNPRVIATEQVGGICQYATTAQVTAGTRTDRAVSPAKLKNEFTRRSTLDGAVQYAEVSLTANEVKALRATPKTLVSAPGAGKVVRFLGAQLILDYGTAQYTESADNMAVKYENGSGVAVSETIEATGFIDASADTLTCAVPVKDAIVAASGCSNKALVLHNTGDGEYGTGDSPVRVKVWYSVLSTGL